MAKILQVDNLIADSILVSRLNDATSLNRIVEWWFMNSLNPEWSDVLKVLRVLGMQHFVHEPVVGVYQSSDKEHMHAMNHVVIAGTSSRPDTTRSSGGVLALPT